MLHRRYRTPSFFRTDAFVRSLVGAAAISIVAAPSVSADPAGTAMLQKMQNLLRGSKFYTQKMHVTEESGRTTDIVIKMVPPKTFSLTTDRGEMIIVKGVAYQRAAGAWKRLPPEAGDMVTKAMVAPITGGGPDNATAKSLGPSDWKGTPCTLYEVHSAGRTPSTLTKVWIRASDGLPLHGESDSVRPTRTIGGKTEGGKRHSVVDFDYTTPVNITAPDVK